MPGHRRRPGRPRPRRAAQAPRRADADRRQGRAPRRSMARALQIAVPARPGLVRPHALPALPRPLADLHTQGPDRRLAGDVRQGHGAELLGENRMREGQLRRSRGPLDGRRAARRQTDDAQARTADPRHRHVWCAQRAGLSGCGNLCRPAAPFQPASRRRRLARQARGGHRCQQLGPRYLCGPGGERRGRHHGAALQHPYRALRHADGSGLRPTLFGGCGRERTDHRQGRHAVRLDPLQGAAAVPSAGLRAGQGTRQGLLRPPGRSGLHARLRR